MQAKVVFRGLKVATYLIGQCTKSKVQGQTNS